MIAPQGETPAPAPAYERTIGRYALYRQIATGGMASVHLGRLVGQAGFSRTVAIKKLHPQYASDPEFVTMFLDEARLATRVRHPNVVPVLDVVALEGELFLVMDYVLGESLSGLLRSARGADDRVPAQMAATVMTGVLFGLHAAHEAKGEHGEALHIVHRDVSPQNILVGVDGVARVVDFGVAKAVGRMQTTKGGQVKGKMAYMAPEQVIAGKIDRRVDVFAASVVLWETLTGRPLFSGDNPGAVVNEVLTKEVPAPSTIAPGTPKTLDQVVLRGLSRNREERWASARDMAVALEHALAPATPRQVGEWVEKTAGEVVRQRAKWLSEVETSPSLHLDPGDVLKTPPPQSELPSEFHDPPGAETRADGPVALAQTARAERARRRRLAAVVGGTALLAAVLAVAQPWRSPAPKVISAPAKPTAPGVTPLPVPEPAPAPDAAPVAAKPVVAAKKPAARRAKAAAKKNASRRPADCKTKQFDTIDGIQYPRKECFQ